MVVGEVREMNVGVGARRPEVDLYARLSEYPDIKCFATIRPAARGRYR